MRSCVIAPGHTREKKRREGKGMGENRNGEGRDKKGRKGKEGNKNEKKEKVSLFLNYQKEKNPQRPRIPGEWKTLVLGESTETWGPFVTVSALPELTVENFCSIFKRPFILEQHRCHGPRVDGTVLWGGYH